MTTSKVCRWACIIYVHHRINYATIHFCFFWDDLIFFNFFLAYTVMHVCNEWEAEYILTSILHLKQKNYRHNKILQYF